ncbi:MAG: IS630 family transposase [Galactobacillus timonensis]|uniref:IS630 family transposase n=1 Tax=Galactobacillus timonensis TaxID=2041840 RepID=UPI0024097469|nr:IS630 family transposase [Galactobacillus timonensis]MDD6600282.1 IS630 family transposase [Galactobacillus timonensis]
MAHAYKIELTIEDIEYLQSLTRQRTIQAQVVDRAKMLLYKAQGMSNKSIADRLDVNINTVKLCLSKFKKGGISRALFDDPRSGRKVEITDDAVAWIIDIACQRPADLGYSQELWTLKNLHCHIQSHAEEAGYPRLASITKPMVQKILKRSDIKPFKIKYYCEKRDPDFEAKMHDVLVVYKQVSMQFDENGNIIIPEGEPMVHTISCDEKPGIQAIATTSEDLRPSEENGCVYRDYEYKRLGTLSLLAGIDLLTGQAIPVVSETHKSSDFICLLKKFDEMYPEGDIIRIICDNHSAHKSKEVQNYLATRAEGRFVFVFTPTHGSWLNLIESFFSKMTKQMLKGIRVKSKEELAERIYLYFDEVNADPVVYHWTYKLDEISVDEAKNKVAI